MAADIPGGLGGSAPHHWATMPQPLFFFSHTHKTQSLSPAGGNPSGTLTRDITALVIPKRDTRDSRKHRKNTDFLIFVWGETVFPFFGPPVGDPITKTRLESFLGTVRSYLTSFNMGSFIWTPFVSIITLFWTLKTGPNCLCQAQPSQNRLFFRGKILEDGIC